MKPSSLCICLYHTSLYSISTRSPSFFSFLFQRPPRLKSFDADEFITTLEHSGPQLTSRLKGNWVALYRYEREYFNSQTSGQTFSFCSELFKKQLLFYVRVDHCKSQVKMKRMLTQNFGGTNKEYYGIFDTG